MSTAKYHMLRGSGTKNLCDGGARGQVGPGVGRSDVLILYSHARGSQEDHQAQGGEESVSDTGIATAQDLVRSDKAIAAMQEIVDAVEIAMLGYSDTGAWRPRLEEALSELDAAHTSTAEHG